MYRRFGKRLFDIMASVCGLVILSPVLLVLACLVKVKLGSPVIFSQDRPGLHGKIFRLYKFRSMTDRRDGDGELLPDGERLTRFGRVLRASSLDELPELWNILRGDMSVVGPRPLAVQYLPYYTDYENRRHDTRPGLTGLAQINGRNALRWEDKFSFDVKYTVEYSVSLDLRIIAKTIGIVLSASSIGERGVGPGIDFDKYRSYDHTGGNKWP